MSLSLGAWRKSIHLQLQLDRSPLPSDGPTPWPSDIQQAIAGGCAVKMSASGCSGVIVFHFASSACVLKAVLEFGPVFVSFKCGKSASLFLRTSEGGWKVSAGANGVSQSNERERAMVGS